MTDYDNPWKEALSLYFQPFLALFFPDAHAEIDWSRGYECLDQELRQIVREGELGRRLVDHLVKVWLNSGQEQWVRIHVEVQTSEEADFARRMYTYNYRLFDRYNREVVSLAVLGDDNPRWRPDRFGYTRWGVRAGIRFPVVKLLDYAEQWERLQESSNPFAMVVLAHLRTLQTRQDEGGRYTSKIKLIKGLYERGWAADDVRRLFRVIDWMMDLPKPLEVNFWQQIKQYEEEKQMPFMTTPERIGREEGLAEGLAKGRTEGRTEGLTKGIEVALELKFGEAGLRLMPEIRAIEDEAKLETVLRAIRTAAGPEDLRRVWTG
jgi:hypothetical protein